MNFVNYALLGIGTGAIYALVAQGLVLIFRGSGVLNFAQAAFAMTGAYAYYECTKAGWPAGLGIVVAVLIPAALGGLLYLFVFRGMSEASPVLKVIVTLGAMVSLQAAAVLRYGTDVRSVPSVLPKGSIKLPTGSRLPTDRLCLLAITVFVGIVLWLVYRFTAFGRQTSAVAESATAAASLGHSPDKIATWNWILGSGLAGLAGALLAPITYLEPSRLVLLILPAIAAALIGRFSSFPLALIGGVVLGMAESVIGFYVTTPGWSQSGPLLIVILLLVFRGSGLPQRGTTFDRLPILGTGRIRPIPVAVTFVVLAFVVWNVTKFTWTNAIAVSLLMTMLCLSIVIVTGFAGQITMAQYVLAGLAAFTAGRFSASVGLNFELSFVIAVLVTTAAGTLIGLTAIRSRGMSLAIATMGFALVIFNVLLNNYQYVSLEGIPVDPPSLFGWDIDPSVHGNRYNIVLLVFVFLTALVTANLRRGRAGRRLIAVRSNERAAAALGVNTRLSKLYAFTLAASIAGAAGVLLGFLQSAILPSQFDVVTSIGLVTSTVLGGLGSVAGGVVGGLIMNGGVLTTWLHGFNGLDRWVTLVSGVSVILILRTQPQGLFFSHRDLFASWLRPVTRRVSAWRASRAHGVVAPERATVTVERERRPQVLSVENISVFYGGVRALSDVSLEVRPGEIHGLIGPNGAGKTTFIDGITGFARLRSGTVRLGDDDITHWPVHRRVKNGLARSFQSLELFDDLSIAENLAIAADPMRLRPFVTDLARPGRIQLNPAAQEVMREFELDEVADALPEGLPYGRRRLVAIARAMAGDPSVLLLDEPAAGLGSSEARELGVLLQKVAHDWGIGVLLVEHNIDVVLSICDRVTVLVQGRVLTSGTPGEIAADQRVRDAYLGVEAGSEGVGGAASPAQGAGLPAR